MSNQENHARNNKSLEKSKRKYFLSRVETRLQVATKSRKMNKHLQLQKDNQLVHTQL